MSERGPCPHDGFETYAEINRLSDAEGGPVTGYSAGIKIRCAGCGTPLVARGGVRGVSPDQPTISFLGDEFRVPVELASEVITALVLGSVQPGEAWWPPDQPVFPEPAARTAPAAVDSVHIALDLPE